LPAPSVGRPQPASLPDPAHLPVGAPCRADIARASQKRAHRWQAVHTRQAAREFANLYRALRKAREDAKDEGGSADFYYSEMEMRRHAAPQFSVERVVLALTWLVAGYALRLAGDGGRGDRDHGVFAAAGRRRAPPLGFWPAASDRASCANRARAAELASPALPDTMLYSVRTALGLPQDPQPKLTRWGGVLQIGLRITVPVLLGLAVLSVRGRVKR